MLQYNLIAIIKEITDSGGYRHKVVVRDYLNLYSTFILPKDEPINKGQVLSFLIKTLKVAAEQIIWPEKIEIPGV